MIENFRKYSSLMVVVLALLFVGLIFLMDSGITSGSGGAGPVVLRVDGRSYKQADVERLGPNAMQIAAQLRMQTLLGQLGGNPYNPDPEQFFIGRLILRQAMDDYGIHPSEESVNAFIRERSAFTSPDGTFEAEAYNRFIQNRIGRYGISEAALRDLVREFLAYEKLFEIVGGGLLPNLAATAHALDESRQEVTLALVSLDLAPFREETNPSDEEIRAFWEERKDAFLTAPQIKVTYFIASPTYPENATAEDEDGTAARSLADRELAEAVDGFLVELGDTNGEDFEALAKEHGWEVTNTDFFDATSVPEPLQLPVKDSFGNRTAAQELFGLEPDGDPLSKFSEAIRVGENQWLIARMDDRRPAEPKSFEDAREEARAMLVEQTAREALAARAAELHGELSEAVAAGTSFAEAAEARDLDVRRVGPFGANQPPADVPAAEQLFTATFRTDPGSLAEVIDAPESAVIAFVEAREVEPLENRDAQIAATADQIATANQYFAFEAWLNQRIEDANVQRPQP